MVGIKYKLVCDGTDIYGSGEQIIVYEKGCSRYNDLIASVDNNDIVTKCRYVARIFGSYNTTRTYYILVGESITVEGTTYLGVE